MSSPHDPFPFPEPLTRQKVYFDSLISKQINNIMTNPQHVTERYIHRLLTRGRNDIFELESVTQRIATHDGIPVGIFFEANVKRSLGFENQVAAGATPREAVRRSLEKHGVTFR